MHPDPTLNLKDPLELPCGAVLKNRIAKSAMSDSLADGEGNPTKRQIRLYEKWAQGGAAISFIGEVQGDPWFPERPGNLVLGPHSNPSQFRLLAERAAIDGAHIWPQIGHEGALTYRPVSHPKGPCALKLDSLECAGMSTDEIHALPGMYARAASQAK